MKNLEQPKTYTLSKQERRPNKNPKLIEGKKSNDQSRNREKTIEKINKTKNQIFEKIKQN